MKISEFAGMNKVTTKMLRHYDEIGLLKPSAIDKETGYRIYSAEQSKYLNWILILKNLEFSLTEIQQMLDNSISSEKFIEALLQKRIEISLEMNEHLQKKVQIDKLIKILEKEGFQMQTKINLMEFDNDNVNELKKNMPNFEQFLEDSNAINTRCNEKESISILRMDISHFKQVNDDYGYDVGDRVILVLYKIIQASIEGFGNKATIGRMGGDEFAIFANVDKNTARQISESIVSRLKEFDFGTIGCPKEIGCYIGVLVGKCLDLKTIRKMLDETIETINKARKEGSNSIFIEDFNK